MWWRRWCAAPQFRHKKALRPLTQSRLTSSKGAGGLYTLPPPAAAGSHDPRAEGGLGGMCAAWHALGSAEAPVLSPGHLPGLHLTLRVHWTGTQGTSSLHHTCRSDRSGPMAVPAPPACCSTGTLAEQVSAEHKRVNGSSAARLRLAGHEPGQYLRQSCLWGGCRPQTLSSKLRPLKTYQRGFLKFVFKSRRPFIYHPEKTPVTF